MTRLNWMRAWLPAMGRTLGRRARELAPWGLTASLTLGLVLLLGASAGPRAGVTAAGAAGASRGGQPATSAASASVASATTRAPRVARADVHVEAQVNGDDLEINLAITQTENDCQTPLRGGVCLRYTVASDEKLVMEGYGVIPASAIRLVGGRLTLRVDTGKTPGFTRDMGPGVVIAMTWQAAAGSKTGALQPSAARGSLGVYSFASGLATSATSATSAAGAATVSVGTRTVSTGTVIIATMYLR